MYIISKRLLLVLTGLVGAMVSNAEDIDIFQYQNLTAKDRPNVLILLDNTANWNTPFSAEKSALVSVVNNLSDQFNVGVMMFTETGSPNDNIDGGYVRFGVRQMTATNKAQLAAMVNDLHSLNDKSNGGKAGLTIAEAWYYFKGATSRSGVGKIKRDYFGNSQNSYAKDLLDGTPFDNSSDRVYNSPVKDLNCQQNYIIYISNGAVQDNNSDTTTARTLLSNEGGNTAQINLSPSGSQTNVADEWARFMFHHTLDNAPKVITYTIDVLPESSGQGPGWSKLLSSMAVQGGGEYYKSDGTTDDLTEKLNDIFARIQDVDSVFASVTLPVSVNVRGTYLNQVYMGVFRPDGSAKPRWPGNLKLYQLGLDSGTKSAFLADSTGARAEDLSTGFVVSTAKSFWTSNSNYWGFRYPQAVSDNPDGARVEKGGAAQKLRSDFATSQTARQLYTCTGTCAVLSNFTTLNGGLTTSVFGLSTTAEKDNLINWVRGADNREDENTDGASNDARASIHGDVLHSRPAVVNYGDGRGIVVYYGGNDGVFHAVRGGTTGTGVGSEMWGVVFPEFFNKLSRIQLNDTAISTTDPKPYFADGAVGTYALDSNQDGVLEKAYIIVSMRRGARAVYAIDVTDPSSPLIKWRKTNSDLPELGYTWSEPRVGKIAANANPVVFMGGGYDPADDQLPATTRTMGRAVYVLDVETGATVKAFTSADNAEFDGAVPADIAIVDRNDDPNSYIDRFYMATTTGKIFRADISDASVSNWRLYHMASLGGTDANDRKFLYKPDVVLGNRFDSILIGSGDREKPFDKTISNRFYMLKDRNTGLNVTAMTAITEADLVPAVTVPVILPDDKHGWYYAFSDAGEKAVGGSATVGGVTFFATNSPTPPTASCKANLGKAKIYGLNYLTAEAEVNISRDGGGYVPTPVPVVVELPNPSDGSLTPTEAVIMGTSVLQPPITKYGQRFRTYWYKRQDKK